MRAIIYIRKSTDKEDNQVLSLESQRDYCLKLAKREGLEVMDIIEEAMSASSPGRPGFSKLMTRMGKDNIDSIITWKLNRIARNPVDAGTFTWHLQNGIIQKTYTEDGVYTPDTNMLLLSVLFGMSQQYTIDLKKDIKRGMRTAVSKGQMISKAPKGYKNDRNTKQAIQNEEAKWIKKIFEWKIEDVSPSEIRKRLKKLGVNMSVETVSRIIANRFYYGILHFQGEYFKGNHTPLVTKDEWDRANKIERARWSKHTDRFPLKGLIKNDAHQLLTASESKGKTGMKFGYYHKGDLRISESAIVKKFEELVLPYLRIPDSRKPEIIDAMRDYEKIEMLDSIQNIDTLEKRKKGLLASKETLFDMRLSGDVDNDTYRAKNAKLHDEIMECEQEIGKIERRDEEIKDKTILLFELLENPIDSWKTLCTMSRAWFISVVSIELFLSKNNGLYIVPKPLFEECMRANNAYGGGDGNRTHVSASVPSRLLL